MLTALATLTTPVLAQPATQAQPFAERSLDLALPAQPLALTLDALARQAGVGIGIETGAAAARNAPALQGRMSLRQALDRALQGSGLVTTISGSGVSVHRRGEAGAAALLPTVDVVAAAEDGSADRAYRVSTNNLGTLGRKSWMDTPYSINVTSRELIENTQAHSLVDALKGDAAVAMGSNYVNGTGEVLSMRGLLLSYRNNYKLDGMDVIGFLGSPQLPVEHLESIEVLRGAAGFLYGFGTPGGIVNMVTKRPTATPTRSINTSVTDSGTVLLHADAGGRFGQDDRFGYRVNLVDEQGDTYVKDGGHVKRRSGSLAMDWRITPDLLLSADLLHQERKVNAVYYQLVPNATGTRSNVIAAAPAPVDGSRRLASPFTFSETRGTTFGTTLDWRFSPGWNARLAYRRWEQDMFSNHSFLYANAAGNYSEMQISLPSRVKAEQAQAVIGGSLDTGGLRHDITFGLSDTDIHAQESNDFKSTIVGTGNLASPGNFADPGLNTSWVEGGWSFPERQRSYFISDTLHLGSQWDLIAGARHNSFRSNSYDKSAVTPTLAVIWRPAPGWSTYASYVEALEQGSVAPTGTLNANEVFPPIKSKQAEVGVKTEGRDWQASASLFRMTQALTYYTATGLYSQDGEARYQGAELQGKARLARQWNLLGSLVLLDATNRRTALGQYDGLRTSGASRQQAAAYVEYQFAGLPLTVTAGGRTVSNRALDTANQWTLSGYSLLDLGARYTTRVNGTRTTFRLNMDNVGDKAYWMMAGSNRLVQGAPRTLRVGAQFEF